MNNIGIGIMCFGDKYYFNFADENVRTFLENNIHSYILTDNIDYFQKKYNTQHCHTISYDREIKSYHDKIVLVKHILKNHDIAIIIDADVIIKENSLINDLKNYQFNKGITYIDTLKNHQCKYEFIKDVKMDSENIEWFNYRKFVEGLYPPFWNLETIYEYLVVFNKDGLNDNFFESYERLQVVKEYCDILRNKNKIKGAGEGVSLHISAKITSTNIQRDIDFYELIKNKILNYNRR
jgi:hypothetical protein